MIFGTIILQLFSILALLSKLLAHLNMRWLIKCILTLIWWKILSHYDMWNIKVPVKYYPTYSLALTQLRKWSPGSVAIILSLTTVGTMLIHKSYNTPLDDNVLNPLTIRFLDLRMFKLTWGWLWRFQKENIRLAEVFIFQWL